MEGETIIVKPFNGKRAGALLGTITEVQDCLKVLYTAIGRNREEGRTWNPLHLPEGVPFEACYACSGAVTDIDPGRMIAPELSLMQGAVLLWAGTVCGPVFMIRQLAANLGIDYEKPLSQQDQQFIDILLYGYDKEPVSYAYKNKLLTGFYRGCVHDLRYMRDAGTTSKGNLRAIDYFSVPASCTECGGSKLNRESLAVELLGLSIVEASRLPILELLAFVQQMEVTLSERELETTSLVRKEMELRLSYLNKKGLRTLIPVKGSDHPRRELPVAE